MIIKKLKKTFIYRTYFKWRYVNPRIFNKQTPLKNEISFLKTFLNKKSIIFDIGANHGDKTEAFQKLGKLVIAFEPDKTNLDFLNFRFHNNSKVIVVNKALSNEISRTTFYVNNHGSGLNTIDKKRQEEANFKISYMVKTTTIDQMINKFGKPDFVKIDVEGHELKVLMGLSQKIDTIVFEANFTESRKYTIGCIEHIYSLSSSYLFNYGFDTGLENNQWMTKEEIKAFLLKSKLKYLNVYCKIF